MENNAINAIVIDDNKDIRDIFVELLKIQKVNVLAVGTDGKEAYELYQKYAPDVSFIDSLMPMYDGFYGLEKIKEHNQKAFVVIMRGALTEKTKIDQYKPDALVEKPFHMEEIQNILQNYVCTI